MFDQISERKMHNIRWMLTSAWIILIASLFYDPISPWLTDPSNLSSPLRAQPEECIKVQGNCLEQEPYALGPPIFWGIVVPSAIFILLVFGHDLWRRICPLSFLSQIPRALGIQRKIKQKSRSGSERYVVPTIKPDSWLGRNYLYLQMGWFFIGLCCRILFINSDRSWLAIWLLFTITAAVTVGYLYGGKSWCNFFCPMAPVQKIYGEPKGLLASQAHTSTNKITQSTCRTVDEKGKEKSACVACQTPCIDIDSERSYWDGVNRQDRQYLYYGYFGLVVGYFLYYYLYAGNWEYYLSGMWSKESNLTNTLFDPGFYLFETPIPIPKLIAVPLTLGSFTVVSLLLGQRVEKTLISQLTPQMPEEEVRHRIYTLCTFLIFNFFFLFAGQSWLRLLPIQVQYLWEALLVFASTIWLYKTWQRSPSRYSREKLANRLRKQLTKLKLDISKFLDDKHLGQLNSDEIYVLAKTIPGFTQQKRQEAYKNILRESLEEGYTDTTTSLELLTRTRDNLEISNDEHTRILEELRIENPQLVDSDYHRSLEKSKRLSSYREALDQLLSISNYANLDQWLRKDPESLRSLRQEYNISHEEEEEILQSINQSSDHINKFEHLMTQLEQLTERFQALHQPCLNRIDSRVLKLLQDTVKQKQCLLIRSLLEIIEAAPDSEANQIANRLGQLSPKVLQEVIETPNARWHDRLNSKHIALLKSPETGTPSCSLNISIETISSHLEALAQDPNLLIQATSLYILHNLNPEVATQKIRELLPQENSNLSLLNELSQQTLDGHHNQLSLSQLPSLEKVTSIYLTEYFKGIHHYTLLELGQISLIKEISKGDTILNEVNQAQELLLLIEGTVEVQRFDSDSGESVKFTVLPGQLLDALEGMARVRDSGSIIASSTQTRILVLPLEKVDALIERDPNLARKIFNLESYRLQQLLSHLQS